MGAAETLVRDMSGSENEKRTFILSSLRGTALNHVKTIWFTKHKSMVVDLLEALEGAAGSMALGGNSMPNSMP